MGLHHPGLLGAVTKSNSIENAGTTTSVTTLHLSRLKMTYPTVNTLFGKRPIWINILSHTPGQLKLIMGRLFIVISDEVERRLRLTVVIRGGRKGDLSATIETAVNEWLKKHAKQIKRAAQAQIK